MYGLLTVKNNLFFPNVFYNKEVSKVVILYKDRLMRFGYEMFAYFCELNDVEIEIIDHTEITGEQELTEDLIQIITVFANRLYGKRSEKTKKLIAEISGKGANPDDDGQKDPASADT